MGAKDVKYEGARFLIAANKSNAKANEGMKWVSQSVFDAGGITYVDLYEKTHDEAYIGVYEIKNNGITIGYSNAEALDLTETAATVIDTDETEIITVDDYDEKVEEKVVEEQTETKEEVTPTEAVEEVTYEDNQTTEENLVPAETEVVVDATNVEIPTFRHEDSNILAKRAVELGIPVELLPIVIGISRWETGNYQYLCGGYNYGGVTGDGSAGHYHSERDNLNYAKYLTKEEGMDAYLLNLKKNYFDQGLVTVEDICAKYVGNYSESWVKGVKGCRK